MNFELTAGEVENLAKQSSGARYFQADRLAFMVWAPYARKGWYLVAVCLSSDDAFAIARRRNGLVKYLAYDQIKPEWFAGFFEEPKGRTLIEG